MEALVLMACMYGQGCSETASAYYLSQPRLQDSVKYTEAVLKQKMGERAFLYAGSAISAVTQRHFTIDITKNITMKGKVWDQLLFLYSWQF